MKLTQPGGLTWDLRGREPGVLLTFDDGPHPEATPFVLDTLDKYQAKASFFCIGKNAQQYPELLAEIQKRGHAVGNHSQHHLNGWKTPRARYLADVAEAAQHISSTLFRPPYGRIGRSQARALKSLGYRIIMWDVISGDFDYKLSGEQCAQNVIKHIGPGSIAVFHDSEKALPRLRYALPRILDHCRANRWDCVALPRP